MSDKGMEAHATRRPEAALFRLDDDDEAAAEELHRHLAGQPVLWPARIDPADGRRRPGQRRRPPLPASPRPRVAPSRSGPAMTGRNCIASIRRGIPIA